MLAGHEVKTTASGGIAIHPDDRADSTALIENAEVAMYRAERRGGSQFDLASWPMANTNKRASPAAVR